MDNPKFKTGDFAILNKGHISGCYVKIVKHQDVDGDNYYFCKSSIYDIKLSECMFVIESSLSEA